MISSSSYIMQCPMRANRQAKRPHSFIPTYVTTTEFWPPYGLGT